jgi:hypothetical protein
MIDPNVDKQLARAKNKQATISLLLQCTESPDAAYFATANNKRERLQLLADFYHSRKKSVLRALEAESAVEVRDIPNSGSLILTGPVFKLQKLVQKGSFLERAPLLQVLPNVPFHSLTGEIFSHATRRNKLADEF